MKTLLALIILASLAWRITLWDRRSGRTLRPNPTPEPYDSHDLCHLQQILIVRAEEELERRRAGRGGEQTISVEWTPCLDEETDIHARYLIKRGPRWGINVVIK